MARAARAVRTAAISVPATLATNASVVIDGSFQYCEIDVLDRAGQRGRRQHLVGRHLLRSCRRASHAPCCAQTSSELAVDIEPHRDRALLLRERDLRVGLQHARWRAAAAPWSWRRSFRLREGEHVAAHDIGDAVIRQHGAAIVLARRLARGDELALGPVAHDLHAGLALDHQAGRVVPVAAGRCRDRRSRAAACRSRRLAELGALRPAPRRACPRSATNMSRPAAVRPGRC